MKILVFTGAKNNGKTTAANRLVREYGYKRLSFADPIKEAGISLGFPAAYVYGDSHMKETIYPLLGCSFRLFATSYGDLLRGLKKESADQMLEAYGRPCIAMYNKIVNSTVDIVIDDCRYPDEARMLRECFPDAVVIVRITRPDVALNEYSGHSSENEYKKIHPDHVLVNDGDIPALERQIDALL